MRARFVIDGRPHDYYYDSEIPFVPSKGMLVFDIPGHSDDPFEVEQANWMHKESYLLISSGPEERPIIDWSDKTKVWEEALSRAGWIKGNASSDPFSSPSAQATLDGLGFFHCGPDFQACTVTRTKRCLFFNHILLVRDLEQLSIKDLLKIKNLGDESLRFIKHSCDRLKIKLREERTMIR